MSSDPVMAAGQQYQRYQGYDDWPAREQETVLRPPASEAYTPEASPDVLGLEEPPARPPATPAETEAETGRLRAAFRREVPAALAPSPAREAALIRRTQAELAAKGETISRPQLIAVVDRSPRVQVIMIAVARPYRPWTVIGETHVSTGKPGRKEHYKTPVGVFHNSADRLGYRAEGTYNENHIRGLGVKGMRVWDFGWQTTQDWRRPGATMQIRMEMHATDPDILAQRIGRPDSEGCIRIPASLNRFLDRHGVIDAEYERAAVTDIAFRHLLLPDRQPSLLAGDTLIVVDSSESPSAAPGSRLAS